MNCQEFEMKMSKSPEQNGTPYLSRRKGVSQIGRRGGTNTTTVVVFVGYMLFS